jgi:hypothetical protein
VSKHGHRKQDKPAVTHVAIISATLLQVVGMAVSVSESKGLWYGMSRTVGTALP